MSRTLLLLLCIGVALPLAAQGDTEVRARQDAEIARLEKTRDSLLVLWREARDLEALQDSLKHAAAVGRLDTIDVGGIRVITNSKRLPLREAAEAYWPILDSLYGDEAQKIRAFPLVLQGVRPDTGGKRRRVGPDYWATPVDEGTTVEGLVNIFRSTLTLGQGDSVMRRWLPGPIRPPVFTAEVEARDAYIGLVTSRYEVSRRCLAGDLSSCRVALRLDDRNATQVLLAYTPAEQRYMVNMMRGTFRHSRELSGIAECGAGSDTACAELLRSVDPSQLPQPLLAESHQVLVHQALRIGGRGAYRRLMADSTASLATRFESAAGIPLDSLVSVWRSAVLAGRPEPVSLPITSALAGLGWVLLLGYFGLRSSRWRLG